MAITISQRIKELGLVLPNVAKPLAAYIPAKVVGNQIWTSGQLPLIDGEVMYPGHVGGNVTEHQGIEAARRAALNAVAAAGQAVGSVDYITRVLKATVYVASDPSFGAQPKVANGASETLAMIFGSEGQHVRSAVGVAALPINAPVEVEVVFEFELPEDK